MAEGYTIVTVRNGNVVSSECVGERSKAVSRAWGSCQGKRSSDVVMVTLPDGRELEVCPKWTMQDLDNEIARQQEG